MLYKGVPCPKPPMHFLVEGSFVSRDFVPKKDSEGESWIYNVTLGKPKIKIRIICVQLLIYNCFYFDGCLQVYDITNNKHLISSHVETKKLNANLFCRNKYCLLIFIKIRQLLQKLFYHIMRWEVAEG